MRNLSTTQAGALCAIVDHGEEPMLGSELKRGMPGIRVTERTLDALVNAHLVDCLNYIWYRATSDGEMWIAEARMNSDRRICADPRDAGFSWDRKAALAERRAAR